MKRNKNLISWMAIIAVAIVALLLFKFVPMSVLGEIEGVEYDYNYAPFNQDYVLVSTTVTDVPDTTATFQLYHESDQHYPQHNISLEKCGQGGAWLDYLNEVCYYDIHKDNRIIYIEGTCMMGNIPATTIEFLNDDIRAIQCTFEYNASDPQIQVLQDYVLDVKLTFTPICNDTEFDKESCLNAWYIQPFVKGDYKVRYDSFGCENYLCETEWQTRNIAVGVLAIILLIILIKFKFTGRGA